MTPSCIIPARGGSKRLARKNLGKVGGVPILVHAINAAVSSGIFDEVHVSTEDEEIADIAHRAGASIAFMRSADLAGDDVPAASVCMDFYHRIIGDVSDDMAIVCLQPSSPLCAPEDISGAWAKFLSSGADFLVSTTEIDPHYFHWALQNADSENWAMYFGSKFLKERTELPPVYRPNGAIKIARSKALADTGPFHNFFGPSLTTLEMPENRSVHVATQTDLAIANALWAIENTCAD